MLEQAAKVACRRALTEHRFGEREHDHKSHGRVRESSQCGAQGPGNLKRKKMSKGGQSSHPGSFSQENDTLPGADNKLWPVAR